MPRMCKGILCGMTFLMASMTVSAGSASAGDRDFGQTLNSFIPEEKSLPVASMNIGSIRFDTKEYEVEGVIRAGEVGGSVWKDPRGVPGLGQQWRLADQVQGIATNPESRQNQFNRDIRA